MILNSVANLKQALHYLDRYTHIHCFRDNDQAGRKTVEIISNVFEYRVTDESFRYADYKDVNDYLMRHRSKDKRYSGDNRLIAAKSSYRRGGLAPRCRRVTSLGWIRCQGLSLIHI